MREIMKRQLIQALIIGSFATMALNAGAQNTSPAGAAQTPSSGAYPSGTTTNPSGTDSMNARPRMTDEQIRDYVDARKACSSQPAAQQESCNTDVNKKFNSVDAKCQKLAGPALADCLRGG
jgi:hypothetical protein